MHEAFGHRAEQSVGHPLAAVGGDDHQVASLAGLHELVDGVANADLELVQLNLVEKAVGVEEVRVVVGDGKGATGFVGCDDLSKRARYCSYARGQSVAQLRNGASS